MFIRQTFLKTMFDKAKRLTKEKIENSKPCTIIHNRRCKIFRKLFFLSFFFINVV